MVGDSPVNDVEPSARVGMVPVLLDRAGVHGTRTAGARVSSLEELPALLENL